MSLASTRPSAADRPDDPLAALLRACADPTRLAILRLLAADAFGVGELVEMLGLGQATISHHLKALSEAGMLTARRDGTHTFYRRALPASGVGARLHSALLAELDLTPLPAHHDAARASVYEARAERSREFFSRHADRFDASRDLIAEPQAYLPELAELLPAAGTRALELGPGPGDFLPELSARFAEVVALDASEEMIERARASSVTAGLTNLILLKGEIRGDAPEQADVAALLQQPFDVIVCAMVLHHTPRPSALVARCAELLAPGGCLLIADLCPHGQDWTQDACGDVWPGIDPEHLRAWADDADLERGPSQFLARRNGFRIQLQRFDDRGSERRAVSAAAASTSTSTSNPT